MYCYFYIICLILSNPCMGKIDFSQLFPMFDCETQMSLNFE